MLKQSKTTPFSTLATVVLAVALPFWFFSYASHHRHFGRDRSMGFSTPIPPTPPTPPFPPGTNDDDDDEDGEDDSDSDTDNENLRSGTFMEEMPTPAPATASFVLEGGAATFRMGETTAKLIDARTKTLNGYSMSIDGAKSSQPNIRLTPAKDGEHVNLNLTDLNNMEGFGEVAVQLNPAPLWDMQMDFGAGNADFDLSRYAVKSLKIEAGAANLTLRLGDRAEQSDVRVSSGMAAVTINVPKGAGVKITTDGGLNSTSIDSDFDKTGSNTYLSPNYGTAAKKITIRYDGGLSSLTVARY